MCFVKALNCEDSQFGCPLRALTFCMRIMVHARRWCGHQNEMLYIGRFHIGCFELRDNMHKVKKREIIRFTVIRFFLWTEMKEKYFINGTEHFLFIVLKFRRGKHRFILNRGGKFLKNCGAASVEDVSSVSPSYIALTKANARNISFETLYGW